MKKERETASIPSEKPGLCSTTEITGMSARPLYRAANGVTIDFHSADFNRTDDLNDCSGNYRFFEPLDGIVTSDMRHQMEHLREEGCVDAPPSEAPVSRRKEEEARRDEPETPEDTSPLTVISKGRTLILDTDVARAGKCGQILSEEQLTCTLVVTRKTGQDAALSWFNRLALIEADDVSITGTFGGFFATVSVKGEQMPLTERFDLVLDLQPTPSFAGRRLPLGYYAPGTSPGDFDRVMAELPEMRGRFQKPHFMTFLTSCCFHGRSSTLDCRRCVEICPFGAIQPENGRISVNHYLCEGCGGCALVCRADAIRPVHPPREEPLNLLKESLASREITAFSTTVVISDGGTDTEKMLDKDTRMGGRIVHFDVEEIGRVGLDVILTAFSHGADRVVVACGTENPEGIRDAVACQTEMARAILKALDMPEDKCRFIVAGEEISFEEEASRTDRLDAETYDAPLLSREFSTRQARSAIIRQGVQHLYDTSGCRKPWLPLPAGSPFGGVAVDRSACTLCMACAAACPSGALSVDGDVPRLLFVEARCHQCGLCGDTCPEHAIQLLPRMLCDPKIVENEVVLCEAETFRCIKCNAPFAAQAMVHHMIAKLKGHWMYANERQLLRLKMCRICRTRDALASEDMKLWNR